MKPSDLNPIAYMSDSEFKRLNEPTKEICKSCKEKTLTVGEQEYLGFCETCYWRAQDELSTR